MAAAIALRDDFDGPALRRLAKGTKDAAQARRLLALAAIYDGGSRTDAARIGDVGLQTMRDWVLRFNARGPAGLLDGKAPGNGPSSMTRSVGPWPRSSSAGRSRPFTRWCAGGWRISRIGYGRASLCPPLVRGQWRAASRSARPRWAANCGRSGIARSPRVRATSRRTGLRSMILQKTSGRTGRDPRRAPGRNRDRAVVAGRSPRRAEELHHPSLGQTRHAAAGPA